jgi:ribosome maturation factor RimP
MKESHKLSFLFNMNQEEVKQRIDEAILENPSLFLVEWKISADNAIEVLVDGDEGVTIDEIVRISRHIEHNLDREEYDFSLNVATAGVGNHLVLPRQYKKNIGRSLKVTKIEGGKDLEGELVSADEEAIVLKWSVREPKPVGKGKHTVEKEEKIEYKEIKKAIVKVIF